MYIRNVLMDICSITVFIWKVTWIDVIESYRIPYISKYKQAKPFSHYKYPKTYQTHTTEPRGAKATSIRYYQDSLNVKGKGLNKKSRIKIQLFCRDDWKKALLTEPWQSVFYTCLKNWLTEL